MLLFADGVENVDRAIASGTAVMLRQPGLWQHLAANPEAIPAAVDECLRFESPALFVGRVAREDIELHGRIIPRNAGVLLMLGAGNRDPEVFPAADTFQPDRTPNRHLAFGQGKHSCIGGPMVRLEMITAFEALTQAFPNLQPTDAPWNGPHASVIAGSRSVRCVLEASLAHSTFLLVGVTTVPSRSTSTSSEPSFCSFFVKSSKLMK